MARIRTTIHRENRAKEVVEWDGDGYNDDPYGEAVAILLNDDPHMTHNSAVVIYTVTGEVLEYTRASDGD